MNNKERSFFRSIRNPDGDFRQKLRMLSLIAPIALGFLATLVLIAVIAAGEIFGDASSFVLYAGRFGNRAMYIIALSILPAFITLKILEIYVAVRLKIRAGEKTEI